MRSAAIVSVPDEVPRTITRSPCLMSPTAPSTIFVTLVVDVAFTVTVLSSRVLTLRVLPSTLTSVPATPSRGPGGRVPGAPCGPEVPDDPDAPDADEVLGALADFAGDVALE